jgi:hypothetical protein
VPIRLDLTLSDYCSNVESHSVGVVNVGDNLELVYALATNNKDIFVLYNTLALQDGVLVFVNKSESMLPLTVGTTPTVSVSKVNGAIMV